MIIVTITQCNAMQGFNFDTQYEPTQCLRQLQHLRDICARTLPGQQLITQLFTVDQLISLYSNLIVHSYIGLSTHQFNKQYF